MMIRQPVAQPELAKLGEQQPDVVVMERQAAADVERAIQRFFHEARHLRLVRHVESGIEVRLERELTQQRQTERIDRADGDFSRTLARFAPQLFDPGPLHRHVSAARSECARAFRLRPSA